MGIPIPPLNKDTLVYHILFRYAKGCSQPAAPAEE
jgi:hypothetical protein